MTPRDRAHAALKAWTARRFFDHDNPDWMTEVQLANEMAEALHAVLLEDQEVLVVEKYGPAPLTPYAMQMMGMKEDEVFRVTIRGTGEQFVVPSPKALMAFNQRLGGERCECGHLFKHHIQTGEGPGACSLLECRCTVYAHPLAAGDSTP